jgi:hypothetical protein
MVCQSKLPQLHWVYLTFTVRYHFGVEELGDASPIDCHEYQKMIFYTISFNYNMETALPTTRTHQQLPHQSPAVTVAITVVLVQSTTVATPSSPSLLVPLTTSVIISVTVIVAV